MLMGWWVEKYWAILTCPLPPLSATDTLCQDQRFPIIRQLLHPTNQRPAAATTNWKPLAATCSTYLASLSLRFAFTFMLLIKNFMDYLIYMVSHCLRGILLCGKLIYSDSIRDFLCSHLVLYSNLRKRLCVTQRPYIIDTCIMDISVACMVIFWLRVNI